MPFKDLPASVAAGFHGCGKASSLGQAQKRFGKNRLRRGLAAGQSHAASARVEGLIAQHFADHIARRAPLPSQRKRAAGQTSRARTELVLLCLRYRAVFPGSAHTSPNWPQRMHCWADKASSG